MTDLGLIPVSCDYPTAGALTGYSADVIRRAVDAGELDPHYPDQGPKQLSKPVVMYEDLHDWIKRGKPERERDR